MFGADFTAARRPSGLHKTMFARNFLKDCLIMESSIVIRTDIRPGDIGSIIKLHGEYYLDKNGLDYTFEPYVAIPISEFVLKNNKRERIWIVENNNEVVGSIAITQLKTKVAQLRWYILRDEYHGKGLGKELICKAIDFAKEMKYSRIILWTISDLGTAIKMYTKNGFKFRTRLSSEV